MIAHYLEAALVRFRHAPFTTAANLLTLALGLACFIAAYGIAAYLGSADLQHENAARTFVLGQSMARQGGGMSPLSPSSNPVAARYLREDIPEVDYVARIMPDPDIAVAAGSEKLFLDAANADPDLLRIFDFEFVEGDARRALDTPNSIVLTLEAARRLFGDRPALGERVVISGREEGVVTGVIGPVPQPSFMGQAPDAPVRFDMLRNWASSPRGSQLDQLENWAIFTGITLVTVPAQMTLESFNIRLDTMVGARVASANPDLALDMTAFPANELMMRGLDSLIFAGSGVDISVVQVLVGLGLLTLLVACINYANLATAQGVARAKEIGMRKALGAGRLHVMSQTWFEAGLLCLAAVLLALGVLALAAPAIEASMSVDILYFLSQGAGPAAGTAALVVLVALIAGAYPALVLSRVRPAEALRSGRSKSGPRLVARTLVGIQFLSASFLLILVTVSQLQRGHLENTALAPREDPIVVLNDLMAVGVDYETLATRLGELPGVRSVSVVDRAPWNLNGFNTLSLARSPEEGTAAPTSYIKSIGYDYFATLNQRVLAGRVFERDRDTVPHPTYFFGGDVSRPFDIVIDRVYASRLGFATAEAAVDEIIYVRSSGPVRPVRIIGVIEEDTTRLEAINISGEPSIAGYVYTFAPEPPFGGQHPIVRIARDDVAGTVAAMTDVWDDLAPNIPINVRFFDDLFEQSFLTFARISQLFAVLAGAAFVIASFGLLGMAAHAARGRRHEIGVRKVLGSSSLGIARLLLIDFSRPVLIANLLAWPLGYLAGQTYLSAFAHRVELTLAPFALSVGITLIIAWAAVIGEVLKAATVRPADVLRYA